MAKYQKIAIIVDAIIIDKPQYVATLEGVSEGKPGDYLVTGVDNEQWFVKPKWFLGAYKHIEGTKYQRKPQILDAEQIDEPEVVKAPTGDIKGDKGDYKVTGTKGEQWFVKPDIFAKTYKKLGGKNMNKSVNGLDMAVNQLGESTVIRYLPKGMKLHNCEIHGRYLHHYTKKDTMCPICQVPTGDGNGTTATQIEHYIDLCKDPIHGAKTIFESIFGR